MILDSYRRYCFLNDLDDIGLTLKKRKLLHLKRSEHRASVNRS